MLSTAMATNVRCARTTTTFPCRDLFKARNFPVANGCQIPILPPLPGSTSHLDQLALGNTKAGNSSSGPNMSREQTGRSCIGHASGKTTKDNLQKTKDPPQNLERFKTAARIFAASRINVEEDHERPLQNIEAKPKNKRRRISSRLIKTNAGLPGNARRNNARDSS